MNKKNIILSTIIVFLMLASTTMISFTVKADTPSVHIYEDRIWCFSYPIKTGDYEDFGAQIVNDETYDVTIDVQWWYNGNLTYPIQEDVTIPAQSDHTWTNHSIMWAGEKGVDQNVTVQLWWNNTMIDSVTWSFNATVSVFFIFNSADPSESPQLWATNPSYMADLSTNNFASTTSLGDRELLDGNTCTGLESGDIVSVWIRTKGYYSGSKHTIKLTPLFGGIPGGNRHEFDTISTSSAWSQWFEITDDPGAPETWNWIDVAILGCDVFANDTPMNPFTLYCSQVEIRVCYT